MIYVAMITFFCSCYFFFFKQKTAYEMRISDWSSDVCSSDLPCARSAHPVLGRSAGHGVKGWVGLVIAEQRRGQCKRDQAERRRCRHDAARHEKSPYPLPEGRRVSRAGAAGHRSIPLSFRSAPESLAWASGSSVDGNRALAERKSTRLHS